MVLCFPAPGGNALSTNDKLASNWGAKRRVLAPWREAAGWAWKRTPMSTRQSIIGVPCFVQITIPFRTSARRDPSNYVGTVCKALVDQLVEQGVWPDDTPDWVNVREPLIIKGDVVTIALVPR